MSEKVLKILEKTGHFTLLNLAKLGEIALFASNSVKHCFAPPFYPRLILRQFLQIGYYSLPVVGLTAIFSGAVLALQSYSGFSRFNAESTIATVVVLSITRELGPVLAGLMVAGRVGASMAAEIGTMKVTEQIDALRTLSTNPFKYLIVPRVIAGVLMLPFLVLIADIIGVMGGYLVSVHALGFSPGPYINNTFKFLETIDVVSGLTKSAVFGLIISIMGCYFGYNSRGGAEGVGVATTNAVVSASIMILLSNYIITGLFFG
jgi:phospholipid/cholesterol/gamma-HCH transport system permease protein